MTITIRVRRPARRSVAVFVAGVLLGIPATVLASHQFPDVPTSHPFHNQISAMAEAGITAGFNDGTYRPSEPVTRQSMAAFMHRGFGRIAQSAGGPPMTAALVAGNGDKFVSQMAVREVTITVPGASNSFMPSQQVYVRGVVTLESGMHDMGDGCPCVMYAVINDLMAPSGPSSVYSEPQYQTFENNGTYGVAWRHSFDVEWVFTATPGTRTYQLAVGLYTRDSTPLTSFPFHKSTSLSAVTVPFGSTGGNTP